MRRYFAQVVFALAAANLLGCAAHVMPATAAARNPPAPTEYRIQPGDQLDIKFYFNPELNDLSIVRPDGRITLQLLGEVVAAGLTPAELTQRLTQLGEKDLAQPRVAVIVRSFGQQHVFVDGEVNKPGLVNIVGTLTVAQAISEGGGMRETANTGFVVVIRRRPGAKPEIMAVNMAKVFDGEDLSEDLPLQPSDIVYVHKSTIANINQWVDQYLRKNIPIPVYIPLTFGAPIL